MATRREVSAGTAVHIFETADALFSRLVSVTVSILLDAGDDAGRCLVVPGGNTPLSFLEGLSKVPLEWRSIRIALTDERCVAMEDARRNEAMVRAVIPRVRLHPLLDEDGRCPAPLAPLADVVVMGMGEDGHVASLFPGSRTLPAAQTASAGALLRVDDAPDGVPRISRSYAGLRGRLGTHLLIRGQAKRRVVEKALDPDSALPVAVVLRAGAEVWWAP